MNLIESTIAIDAVVHDDDYFNHLSERVFQGSPLRPRKGLCKVVRNIESEKEQATTD